MYWKRTYWPGVGNYWKLCNDVMQTNKCTVVKPNLILISTAPLHVLYVSKPMARVEEDNCYLEFPGVVSKPGT